MTDAKPETPVKKMSKITGLFVWLIALALSAGLISFLFWQPEIAEIAAAYKNVPMQISSSPSDSETVEAAAALPEFEPSIGTNILARMPDLETNRNSEFRTEPIKYVVNNGDSVWGIAEKFQVSVESILYANYDILMDKSDNLMPGQELTIPPVDGIMHKWRKTDTFSVVASKYGANIEDILLFIGNNLDLANPEVNPGTIVMVPGGARELINYTYGNITISDDGTIRSGFSGPGSCAISGFGISGSGTFIWPSSVHMISGNNYGPGHLAIDIGAGLGSPLYASDSGTVVYAGWLNGGYGNFVVIDHNNGFQTLYEHLDTLAVSCGQTIYQGAMIGTSGTTGNSTGPHLHFEIRYGGVAVNPWNYLP